MPTPVQSDLHINAPLTNVSIAYMQSASTYIADKIFPKVPVQKQGDLFWKYSKSDWRRSDVKKRAPGTESAGTGWKNDTDQYYCHVYAVHKDIDDQTRANADSNFNLDRDSTENITNQLLLQRDVDWATAFFKTGVWATDKVGTTDFVKWSDGGSDPISDVADIHLEFRKLTGFKPNICVLGAEVMKELKQHPDIIDRIKYTQKGIVSEDLIATLFDVDELYTSYATIADTAELTDARVQDAAATYDFITNAKGVLFAYAPKSPSLMTPSAGYTFTWKGYMGGNSQGIKIKRFRMEHLNSDRVEGEQTYDMHVVSPDCGYFLSDTVV
jgi:hypothetical protein